MKTYTIANTNASQITITPSVGTATVLDKVSVTMGVEGPYLRIHGFQGSKEKNLTIKYTAVTTPASSASATALKNTVQGYVSATSDVQVFTPLTGVTIAPVASKAPRLVALVKPAGTIAALTITMPALVDGQIFSLTTTQIVSTLTITANGTSTIQNAPTAGTTTLTRSWIYNAAQDTLFVI